MSIVDIEEVLVYMRSEQPTDRSIVVDALAAAHTVFYDMCQRSFEVAGAVATARLYVATASDVLRIHDCVSITSVTLDGSLIAGSAYQAEPVAIAWNGEARPFEQIRRFYGDWSGAGSLIGQATASVVARWGWAASPPLAITAIKSLTKDIATNRDVRAGFLSFGEAGVAVARANRLVSDAASRLARDESIGIG